MPRRSGLSIPHELHQIKAQKIYEQRKAKERNGSSEEDWETARRYLTRYPKVVRAWKRNQAFAFYRQLPRSLFRKLAQSFKAFIGVIGKIITFPFWLFYKLPQLFTNTETKPFALDIVKTIISAASLIAVIVAAIGLFVNYQDALKDRELTQERLVTDRFTKAVEQLGSTKEEVVIGGIYSLERIAKDSPKDQWTIMEVLTAFVRNNSPIPPEIHELLPVEKQSQVFEKLEPINIPVQAALTVIGRRNPGRDYTIEEVQDSRPKIKRLNLSNSNLRGADLRYARLKGANLNGADLMFADLNDANLDGADLRYARLEGANLDGADLRYAHFKGANLNGADLMFADLSDTDLSSANLSNANLSGVNLSDTHFNNANLSSVELFGADLSSADLSSANLSSANLRIANLSNTYLGSANLSDQQIKSACFWESAIYTDVVWNVTENKMIAKNEKANEKKIKEIKKNRASDLQNPPNCNG